MRPNIIVRALELAQTGEFNRKSDIAKRLTREGYDQADQHLDAPSVSRMVRVEIAKGRQQQAISDAESASPSVTSGGDPNSVEA